MKLLIIPDIHGRDFWIEPCSHVDEFDKIIFLGDYHDPYSYEVSQDVSRHRLRDELLPFVLEHRNKCICLFGNHDGNYLVGDMADRLDRFHQKEIYQYLKQMDLRLIYREGKYLFSHSGVLPAWLDINELSLERLEKLSLNNSSLLQVSPYRGGYSEVGSCVWGDVREYAASEHIPDIYQIFGHTQLQKDPIIEKDWADLDCRKAFVLENDVITEWKP